MGNLFLGLGRDNKPPTDGAFRLRMLVMVLGRHRFIVGDANLVATTFAAVDARIPGLCTRLMQQVKVRVI
jgi:hypothetical protein